MADAKFLQYQDTDNTNLLDKCDELIDVKESNSCPSCRKNYSYIAPDWTSRDVDEPWLNERTCEFEITIVTEEVSLVPYPGANQAEAERHMSEMFSNYCDEAINGILDFTNKETSEHIVESLKSVVEFSKYHLSERIKTRVKLLYAIPYDNIAVLDNMEDDVDESDEDAEGTPIEVTYDADTFNSNVLKIRRSLELYGKYLTMFKYAQRGNLIFAEDNSVFQLSRYGDNGITGTGVMERVVKSIDNFLNSKGYRLRGGAWSRLGNDIVTEIGFKFNKDYKLKRITIKTLNCREKEIVFKSKQIRRLNTKGDFKDATAMAYLSRIEDMLADLEARVPKPWLDFIKEYTYPQVIDSFNWPFADETTTENASSCVGEVLKSEAKQMAVDILDVDLSLADAFVYLFNKQICLKDADELLERRVKMNEVYDPDNRDYVSIRTMAQRQAFQQLQLEEGVFLAACFRMMSSKEDSDRDNVRTKRSIRELFRNFFQRIKLCGMNKMTAQAISCLIANLPFEEALNSIVKAAVENMSLVNFGKLFAGLPLQDQQELDKLVKQKLESSQFFSDEGKNEKLADFIDEGGNPDELASHRPWERGELISELNAAADTSRGESATAAARPALRGDESVTNNTHTKSLAQRYQEVTTADRKKSTTIMALYIDALLEHYGNNLLAIVERLNSFPGAELITKTLLLLDCPQPALINPPNLEFIHDLQMPFCKNIDDITLPVIRNPFAWIPEWKDITGAAKKSLKLVLQQILVSTLTRLMVKICTLIGGAMCRGLGAAGKVMATLANPNDPTALSDAIRVAICGEDADEDQVQSTVAEMFETLGLGSAALADQEQVINFSEDISSSLTRTEMLSMFMGDASYGALVAIDDLIENEYEDYRQALPSTTAIADFFKGMGDLFPVEFRDSLQDFLDSLPDADRLPANPSLCATPQQIEDFCAHRGALLRNRATEEQIQMLCSNHQDDLVGQLDDLASALHGDPVADAIPPIVSDPGCDNGLVPFESDQVISAREKSMDDTMKEIHLEFSKDMLGNGPGERNWGMINMIMSDTMGNPLTYHYRRSFNRKNYVDFYTVQDEPFNVEDIMNWEWGAQAAGALLGLAPEGQFPYKVADYLQANIAGSPSFSTNNNFREAVTKTKTFESLNLSLYGTVDTLRLPDFGYNTSVSVDASAGMLYVTRAGRKMDPDLEVEFTDNNRGMREDDAYLYGFNLKLFLSEMEESTDENGQKVVTNLMSDNARINISNLLNFNADITRADIRNMTRDQRKEYRDRFEPKEPSIQKERVFEFIVTEDTFNLYDLTAYPKFQESFYSQQDYMPQTILLREIAELQGIDISLDAVKSFQDSTMTAIHGRIRTEISGNEAPWMYGATYDSLTEEDIEYVVEAGQTDSAAGTLYSDATIDGNSITNDDAVLGVSRHQLSTTPELNRVYYLDPAVYGGSYVNPPLYIKPIKNQGWMGFIDVLFPDLSPCKPSHTDIIDFGEISEQIASSYYNIPMDERLTHDEDCVNELPYNRVLERHAIAGIEGVIKAACKIYSSVHFIKSIATFTTFKPDFENMYSSLYPKYIVENMERSFKDAQGAVWEFFNPFKDEGILVCFLRTSSTDLWPLD